MLLVTPLLRHQTAPVSDRVWCKSLQALLFLQFFTPHTHYPGLASPRFGTLVYVAQLGKEWRDIGHHAERVEDAKEGAFP